MTQQFKVAWIRAGVGGLVLAGSAFFGQLATGGTLRTAGVAAGVAFFAYLILRGGVEGLVDSANAQAPTPLK
jgi:hypothetical protein